MPGLFVVEYKSLEELRHVHQDVEKFTVIYQIPRGQTEAGIQAELNKKKIHGRVYQVGNFIWKPAETLPKIE